MKLMPTPSVSQKCIDLSTSSFKVGTIQERDQGGGSLVSGNHCEPEVNNCFIISKICFEVARCYLLEWSPTHLSVDQWSEQQSCSLPHSSRFILLFITWQKCSVPEPNKSTTTWYHNLVYPMRSAWIKESSLVEMVFLIYQVLRQYHKITDINCLNENDIRWIKTLLEKHLSTIYLGSKIKQNKMETFQKTLIMAN